MSGQTVQSLAFIGGGKMAEAILSGLLDSSAPFMAQVDAAHIFVANPGLQKREHLEQRYGVSCVADGSELPRASVVFLAVKPQILPEVVEGLRDAAVFSADSQGERPLVVSIAAGVTMAALRELLPAGTRVVRTMPNMPLLIGCGMTAVVGDEGVLPDDAQFVRSMFACLGDAVVVDERDMDAICALSGSGPGYVAAIVEALRDAGMNQGLDSALAQKLALQTLLGTARLLAQTGQEPDALRIAVCSPGGTTIAALDAMYAAGFSDVFDKGVAAATARSKELGAS